MFGIDLWDASLAPALLVAAAAGVLSFLSPCVLPIVPPYLAFMAGASLDEAADRRRPQLLGTAAFFVLGLSTVFLLLGLAASALGRALLAWQEQMTMLAGAVIVLFGLHFLGVLRIPLLNREARLAAQGEAGTALGAYLFGLAFAFGWTPCIGPVLGAILALAVQGGSTGARPPAHGRLRHGPRHPLPAHRPLPRPRHRASCPASSATCPRSSAPPAPSSSSSAS